VTHEIPLRRPQRTSGAPGGWALPERPRHRDMPRLSPFHGIVIYMYRPDHPPPHFHAQYGEHIAQIELGSWEILNGELPYRALRLVRSSSDVGANGRGNDSTATGGAGSSRGCRLLGPEEKEKKEMVKLVVAYGQPEDPAAFDEHYASTHGPLAQKIPGLRRFEAGKVLGTPDGSAAPFYFIAELLFDSADELQVGMSSNEGQAAAEDVATFATGGATLMIAET
jgi:uncharacterized protein (TIGR02118 family)